MRGSATGPVGPKYGTPGYKESHNWEAGWDKFSPLVFNSDFFAANYQGEAQGGQEKAMTLWADSLHKKYPNCPQGTASFSANTYYRANPDAFNQMIAKDMSCGQIVQHYLSQGIYDGLKTYSASAEHKAMGKIGMQQARVAQLQGDTAAVRLTSAHGEDEWNLASIPAPIEHTNGLELSTGATQNMGTPVAAHGGVQYSYSFRMKLGKKSPEKSSVLRYGGQRVVSPAISQIDKHLDVQVSLASNPDFACMPEAELSQYDWTFVVVAVQKSGVDVYYDGKVAKSCSFNGAAAQVLGGKHKLVLGDVAPGATDASIKDLMYYPGER
jgi:hypothetical protein